MTQVIAYTWEADTHCIPCTRAAFGEENEYGELHGLDAEGNRIFPIFDTDEWYANESHQGEPEATLACGTCGEIIAKVSIYPL